MDNKVVKVIEDEIERQVLEIPDMQLGVDEYSTMARGISDLTKAVSEYRKETIEAEAKQAEVKRDTILNSITAGVSVGGLLLGIAEFVKRQEWIKAGFIFEETGSFCTQTMKHLFTGIFKK